MSFASEPGRDDGNLPPVNIVIPDDARELDREVLAYHREQRARRRRQRILRLFGPFGRREFGGHAALLPLIATCVALSMLAGAMLSVMTISPASEPPSPSASTGAVWDEIAALPTGAVLVDGKSVAVSSLVNSAIALIPANCDCGTDLLRLAEQARAARVDHLYFAGSTVSQTANLTTRYGDGTAEAVYDTADVLATAFHPVGLTVLLVDADATGKMLRDLPPDFQLGPDLGQLATTATAAS